MNSLYKFVDLNIFDYNGPHVLDKNLVKMR